MCHKLVYGMDFIFFYSVKLSDRSFIYMHFESVSVSVD